MRYLLHLRFDGEIFRDAQGMDLPDLEAACFHATKIARDIMGEEARNGRLPLAWSIEVEDKLREIVTEIPFRDALTVQ
ncbi:hypothetical protein GCM10008023_37400 [Sphingomonas glacialis]|uniref:DUF6894 domain-containing protein n=1 Tax=Sphingomonas glacialis TaxID=658225 RepID=A0ABQ3LSF1_9SPHN|nr:hypothetical protein [Sphingomonas glacialis]GHH24892.1 hypothetical protein GCM10008023_37400 [Sphingomonas glacialis]